MFSEMRTDSADRGATSDAADQSEDNACAGTCSSVGYVKIIPSIADWLWN